jgi:hypothetical protein
LIQAAKRLKRAAVGYDSGLECDAVKVASASEVLAVKQICRYLPSARSGRGGCDIVGVDLDVIHVSYKVKELGHRLCLAVNILGLLFITCMMLVITWTCAEPHTIESYDKAP